MAKNEIKLTVHITAPHIESEGLSTSAEAYVMQDIMTRFPKDWEITIISCDSTVEI
jgi:hypothetical protein